MVPQKRQANRNGRLMFLEQVRCRVMGLQKGYVFLDEETLPAKRVLGCLVLGPQRAFAALQ